MNAVGSYPFSSAQVLRKETTVRPGKWVGQKIRGRIDQETFRKALLVTLFIIGLNLIRRAVF